MQDENAGGFDLVCLCPSPLAFVPSPEVLHTGAAGMAGAVGFVPAWQPALPTAPQEHGQKSPAPAVQPGHTAASNMGFKFTYQFPYFLKWIFCFCC